LVEALQQAGQCGEDNRFAVRRFGGMAVGRKRAGFGGVA
jgi:hypothetical protein